MIEPWGDVRLKFKKYLVISWWCKLRNLFLNSRAISRARPGSFARYDGGDGSRCSIIVCTAFVSRSVDYNMNSEKMEGQNKSPKREKCGVETRVTA